MARTIAELREYMESRYPGFKTACDEQRPIVRAWLESRVWLWPTSERHP